MMTKVEQIETVLRERYLSFRLHHADLKTMASPERFANLFVEWSSSAVLAALTLPAETEGGEVEALARIRRFAESRAITARAHPRQHRHWLDLLILLDTADADIRRPAESDGLAEKVRALVGAYDRAAKDLRPSAATDPLISASDRGKRAVYLRCRDDLRALLDAPTQEGER